MGKYLNVFLLNFEKIKVIIQNFSVTFAGGNYVENSFLDASLNLEVLHREFFSEKKEVNNELTEAKELIKSALKQTRGELKEKILSSLNNLDDTTLRKKCLNCWEICQIIYLISLILKGTILIIVREKNFAIMCSNTRKYITHRSSNDQLKIFSSVDLIKVAKILNIVSEYHVMKIISLEDKDIIEAISHENYYQKILTNRYEFQDLN